MRFVPHSDADVARMLEAVGAASTNELFAAIPESIRRKAGLALPEGLGEQQVLERMEELAGRNRTLGTFQGAGSYNHFIPSVVHQVISRSELATAYTPYQPEVSQGTLQICFEFQTYIAILTGLEVANASMYDGASALAEAVLMALRLGRKRSRILVSDGVHPEYVAVVATYLDGFGRGRIERVPLAADGRTDLGALEKMLDADVACVCTGYPNFLGIVDDLAGASRLAAAHGAVSISATSEMLALALLRSPGSCGVDIAVAEGQSLGLPMSYGGPGVGLFATRREHVRQMPGRLVGETVDDEGRRGYVLTLATREQHIRREKATSNICTNQGLAAVASTVFLSLAGKRGLRHLAALNARRAAEVAARLADEAGLRRVYPGPFFNEFVIEEPSRRDWFRDAVEHGIVPGVRLGELFPDRKELAGKVLVTVTECNGADQIDTLVRCLAARRAA
jgi:glycine dehydrogenase subunit 1